jgi:thiosulfate/3-mercaptopyruvate sulfurtransferase
MTFTTLVTPAALDAHLDDPDWCIVDCRHDLLDHAFGRREYDKGHIDGAFFADSETDLAGPKTGSNGRHPLPQRDAVADLFRRWGMSNRSQLVAYDAQGGAFAVRLWWLARWLGHANAAVLDGGWRAWVAGGRRTSRSVPQRAAGTFSPAAPLVGDIDAAYVLAHLNDDRTIVLDARSAERYAGEQEPIDPVAGHIPGALNRFWQANLADGRFKSAAELRAEFDALLAGRAPAEVIHVCGSGVTACHNLLAMEIAGLPGGRLYAGSWSEWVADRSRPVGRGRKP